MRYTGEIRRIHVFGHPCLPLDVPGAPADAQVFNCQNFCRLLSTIALPFAYYGISGSRVPSGGRFIDLGIPEDTAWEYGNEWHKSYTARLSQAFASEREQTDDQPELVASLYGAAHMDVETGDIPVIEAMIGYDHCCDTYRVFPSYAHQQTIYTAQAELVQHTRHFDTVIPHFLDLGQYELGARDGGYALYLGRNAADKGIAIAEDICKTAGIPLKKVFSGYSGKRKSGLIGSAVAVLMPTLYLEPFGYVAVEAQLCGVPVITTDWGAFAETVEHGVTGFRCRTQAEFLAALAKAPALDAKRIRKRATERFSLENVLPQYAAYFDFVWKVHAHGGYYAPNAIRAPL